MDVDSSFNQTLEPENIEDEKRLIKSKPVGKRLLEMTEELAGCKLDGSAIVFEDSEDEADPKEVHPLGPEEVINEGFIEQNPAEDLGEDPPLVAAMTFEEENGVDDARALQEALSQLKSYQ